MTTKNATSLSEELKGLVAPAYSIKAMLQGALALLNEAEALPDPGGDVWAARELVEEACARLDEIYGDKESALLSRLATIDQRTAVQ